MHTGIQADNHTLELFRLDVRSLTSIVEMLGQDQTPAMDLDFKADCFTRVRVDRHFVGITSPFAVEFAFHDVTWCIGMSACVLNTINPLGEDAALCHGVHRIDDRLHEIRPTWDLRTEWMSQIHEYFLSHFFLLFLLFVINIH